MWPMNWASMTLIIFQGSSKKAQAKAQVNFCPGRICRVNKMNCPFPLFFGPLLLPHKIYKKMKFALVTGANKSIVFEVVQQLPQKGIYVYLGSRNLENGIEAIDKLKAAGLNNVEVIQLNITD